MNTITLRNTVDTVNEIESILLPFSNFVGVKKMRTNPFSDKLESLVKNGETLNFLLPAFPAKSPNRLKTAGNLPDYAEVLGLERLQSICEAIEHVYEPGAIVTICSDGRVFNDLVRVGEEEVSDYSHALQSIAHRFQLQNIRFFDLDEAYANITNEERRSRLIQYFGFSIDLFKEQMKKDPSKLLLFNGIHRFLFEDFLFLYPNGSRTQVRESTKHIAYEVVQRSQAWGDLLKEFFPNALRLSIHPQMQNSEKFPVQLVESKDHWRTPWHSVAVTDGKKFFLMKREEAELLKATPEHFEDSFLYFRVDGV